MRVRFPRDIEWLPGRAMNDYRPTYYLFVQPRQAVEVNQGRFRPGGPCSQRADGRKPTVQVCIGGIWRTAEDRFNLPAGHVRTDTPGLFQEGRVQQPVG